MTYSPQTPATAFTGDGSVPTPKDFNFRVDDNTHLKVQYQVEGSPKVLLVEGVNYTLTQSVPPDGSIQFPEGGQVVFDPVQGAIPDTAFCTMFRDTPADQTTAYMPFGDFPAASHELALDRSAMRDDEQNAKLSGFIPTDGLFVNSFTGNQGTSRDGDVTALTGDYDADMITETAGRIFFDSVSAAELADLVASIAGHDDVNPAGAVDGDFLKYNGANWVPGLPVIQDAWFEGYNANVGGELVFTNEDDNIDGNGIATIKNDALGGRGWLLTAVVKCHVVISANLGISQNDTDTRVGLQIVQDIASTNRILSRSDQRTRQTNSLAHIVTANPSTSVVLEAGETLSIEAFAFSIVSFASCGATVTVQKVA